MSVQSMMKAGWVVALLGGLWLAGCRDNSSASGGRGEAGTGAGSAGEATTQQNPNRLDIPAGVRQNLGITFAKVERRRVGATLRVPGRFELAPEGRREYITPFGGHVELLVAQYQVVKPGTPLYRIKSPQWLQLRQNLMEGQLALEKHAAELAVAQAALAEANQSIRLLEQRVEALAKAEVRRADLELQLAEKKNSLPRLEAERRKAQVDLEGARQRFPLTLASAASLTGLDAAHLEEKVGQPPRPRWSQMDWIEVRAIEEAAVEKLAVTNGAWVEDHKLVLSTADMRRVRFRGPALQADLNRLREGQAVRIVPPAGSGDKPLSGTLKLDLQANPETRTLDVLARPEPPAEWARPGLSTFMEVCVDQSEDPELAIPLAAVIQDGLERVFFRRDPKNPDQALRVEADMGVSDGQWVVVNSGLKAGDEVVVDGVYELKLASAAKAKPAAKGHYHADGTYHEGKH